MNLIARYRDVIHRLVSCHPCSRWPAAVGRFGAVATVGVIAILIGCGASAFARQSPPTTLHLGQPMRVVLVKRPDGTCTDTCPEWISAEGTIMPETTAEFRKILKSIGHRKLPLFINSNGGSVEAAFEIGRMLRAHHIDVSVTRTSFDGCSPESQICNKDPGFKGYRGWPVSSVVFCASACPILIAGGERRFISPASFVGVHETTMVQRRSVREYKVTTEEVGGRKLRVRRRVVTTEMSDPVVVKNAALTREIRGEIVGYFREMGVSANIVDVAFATKASDIHWLSRDDLASTHLMTDAIGGETLFGPELKRPTDLTVVTGVGQLRALDDGPAEKFFSPARTGSASAGGPAGLASSLDPTGFGRLRDAVKALSTDKPPVAMAKPGAMPPSLSQTRPNLAPPISGPSLSAPDANPHVETTEISDIVVNRDFGIELVFTHQPNQSQVGWVAMIRYNGWLQPAAWRAIRLVLGDGRGFSASPSMADEPQSQKLHGEMDLHDYCDLARGTEVVIRLTVPKVDHASSEVLSEPKELLAGQTPWIACAPGKAAALRMPAP